MTARPSFYVAWWRRHRAWRAQRFWQQLLENRAAWGERLEVEDLTDPHGKRLLFGIQKRVAQQTSGDGDGPRGG